MSQISSLFGTVNDNYYLNVDINNGEGEFNIPGFFESRNCGLFVKQLNFIDYEDNYDNSFGISNFLVFEEERTKLDDGSKQKEFYESFIKLWRENIGKYVSVLSISFFKNKKIYLKDIIIIHSLVLEYGDNYYLNKELKKFLDEKNTGISLDFIDFMNYKTYPDFDSLKSQNFNVNIAFTSFKPLNFEINDSKVFVTFGNMLNGPKKIDCIKNVFYEKKSQHFDSGFQIMYDNGIPYFYHNVIAPEIRKEQCVIVSSVFERYLTVCFGFLTTLFLDCYNELIVSIEANPFILFHEINSGDFFDYCLIGSDDLIKADSLILDFYADAAVDIFTKSFVPSNELVQKSDILMITSDHLYKSTLLDKSKFSFEGVLYYGPSHYHNPVPENERQYIYIKPGEINPFKIQVGKLVKGISGPTSITTPVTGKLYMDLHFVNIVNPLVYDSFGATWR